jgi:hypothetical protein
MRVAGTLMVGLGLFIWLPMTIGCFISAASFPEKDLWIKLGAGLFNGAVAFMLQWGGRKLFRGPAPKQSQLPSENPVN